MDEVFTIIRKDCITISPLTTSTKTVFDKFSQAPSGLLTLMNMVFPRNSREFLAPSPMFETLYYRECPKTIKFIKELKSLFLIHICKKDMMSEQMENASEVENRSLDK